MSFVGRQNTSLSDPPKESKSGDDHLNKKQRDQVLELITLALISQPVIPADAGIQRVPLISINAVEYWYSGPVSGQPTGLPRRTKTFQVRADACQHAIPIA